MPGHCPKTNPFGPAKPVGAPGPVPNDIATDGKSEPASGGTGPIPRKVAPGVLTQAKETIEQVVVQVADKFTELHK